jgi:hypothetical protein
MNAFTLACRAFSVDVDTDAAGRIVGGSVIVRRFLGCPLGDLESWIARKFGAFTKQPRFGLFDAVEVTGNPAGKIGA